MRRIRLRLIPPLLCLAFSAPAARAQSIGPAPSLHGEAGGEAGKEAALETAAARDFVLRPVPGETRLDGRIRALQNLLRSLPEGGPRMEELGWLFIAKARGASDEGFFRHAERCALLIDAAHPGSAAALLLKGHALQSMHRFAEAEDAGRAAVKARGIGPDYGLLGDALMERGRLDEALIAYQAMMDRKPGSEAYARAAHLRWLTGDVPGAEAMMAMAVAAASPREPEALAWAYAKLAGYRFQRGNPAGARNALRAALEYVPGYPPALELRGRIALAGGHAAAALPDLEAAARSRALPEHLWAWSDALRLAGKRVSADSVDALIEAGGARMDPRSFSLFLSTRCLSTRSLSTPPTRASDAALALSLAQRELGARSDVFTHDAAAWAALASGDPASASAHADSALARGTRDARLYLHAGLIARARGRAASARTRLRTARELSHLLLPSERKLLEKALALRPLDPNLPATARAAPRMAGALPGGETQDPALR